MFYFIIILEISILSKALLWARTEDLLISFFLATDFRVIDSTILPEKEVLEREKKNYYYLMS